MVTLQGPAQSLPHEHNPLMVSLSNHLTLSNGASFDKLRMSGAVSRGLLPPALPLLPRIHVAGQLLDGLSKSSFPVAGFGELVA